MKGVYSAFHSVYHCPSWVKSAGGNTTATLLSRPPEVCMLEQPWLDLYWGGMWWEEGEDILDVVYIAELVCDCMYICTSLPCLARFSSQTLATLFSSPQCVSLVLTHMVCSDHLYELGAITSDDFACSFELQTWHCLQRIMCRVICHIFPPFLSHSFSQQRTGPRGRGMGVLGLPRQPRSNDHYWYQALSHTCVIAHPLS